MQTTHDSIDRRNRFVRTPTGKDISINNRDVEWFHFLHRHGGRLPTSYLHEATRDTHRSELWSKNRLKDLFHESGHLDRDWRQQETLDPRYNEIIHQLNKKSHAVLEHEGLLFPNAPSMKGAYKHQVMLSCVSASFELNATDSEIAFIPQHEIVDKTSIFVDNVEVRPDAILGLTKCDKKLMLFVEVDRSTEQSYESPASRRKARQTIELKINHYKEIIGRKLYQAHYGFAGGAFLLFITTGQGRANTFLDIVDRNIGSCSYMLASSLPEFGRAFHPPKKLDMLGRNWQRNYKEDWQF